RQPASVLCIRSKEHVERMHHEARWFRRVATVPVAAALLLGAAVRVSLAQRDSVAPTKLSNDPLLLESYGQKFRAVPLNGFTQPWALAFLPNGDLLVTERRGTLRLVHNWTLDPTPISGTPPVAIGALKGLMDIALHPRFNDNHLVYFTYSKLTQPGEKTIGT